MPAIEFLRPRSPKPIGRLGCACALKTPELCPRYTARVVRRVKIGPSPDWLRSTLEKVGIRSINNVVDVTNYVMLESGQPLHAFDYHLIAKGNGRQTPTIVVRRAADGEKFTTLDGKERTLTNQMLLIADETKAIALAGVMGGQNTEINDRHRGCADRERVFQAAKHPRHLQETRIAHRILLPLRARRATSASAIGPAGARRN